MIIYRVGGFSKLIFLEIILEILKILVIVLMLLKLDWKKDIFIVSFFNKLAYFILFNDFRVKVIIFGVVWGLIFIFGVIRVLNLVEVEKDIVHFSSHQWVGRIISGLSWFEIKIFRVIRIKARRWVRMLGK